MKRDISFWKIVVDKNGDTHLEFWVGYQEHSYPYDYRTRKLGSQMYIQNHWYELQYINLEEV